MTILEPICFRCKHFRPFEGGCDAFPDGDIPDEVTSGEDKHSKPLEDQENDIVFEPIENESKIIHQTPS